MTKIDSLLAGVGIGILVTNLFLKLFDISWLLISIGVVLLLISGARSLQK
ncbi:MAG TPA: hypothetical protein VEB18_04270 [Candidatus Paceibacterota bacterium]|nr:hypothetical protein [Candidatus Paceibacterota bacterium]